MNRHLLRSITLVLALCVLITALPVRAFASDEQEDLEAYRERVFTRYDNSLENSSYFENLCNSYGYNYIKWGQIIENENTTDKVIMWCAEFLMDSLQTKDSYMTYLATIMALMEQGFTESKAAQAAYTAKMSSLDKGKVAAGVPLEYILEVASIFSLDELKELQHVYTLLKTDLDLVQISQKAIKDYDQIALVAASSVLYEQKVVVLRAIRDNTDDGYLKDAADQMLQVVSMQYAYVLSNFNLGLAKTWASVFDSVLDVETFRKQIPTLYKKISSEFTDWISANLSEKAAASAAGILQAAGKVASFAFYVGIGFKLGGEIMKLFQKDQMELFREMKAMYQISDALMASFQKSSNSISTATGNTNERLLLVQNYVAIGEALVYTHLRGDYCNMASRTEDNDEGIEEYFEALTHNLNEYYNVLDSIFPDREPQVYVTARRTVTTSDIFYGQVNLPVIEVVNNPAATKAIMESEMIRNIYTNAPARTQEYLDMAAAQADGDPFFYNFYISDVSVVGSALHIKFHENSYSGGAHGLVSRSSVIFDLETGKEVTFRDMLADTEDAQQLMRDTIQNAIEEAEIRSLFVTPEAIASAIVSGTGYQDNVSLSEDGMSISFSMYEIAPAYVGTPTIQIPYQALEGILADKFIPETTLDDGTIALYSASEEIPGGLTHRGAESGAAVVTTGTVWDVSIFTVTETANGSASLLFYANYMDDELFWIPENTTYLTLRYGDVEDVYDMETIQPAA